MKAKVKLNGTIIVAPISKFDDRTLSIIVNNSRLIISKKEVIEYVKPANRSSK